MGKSKKKESPAGFRNGDLFCYNCGQSLHVDFPQPLQLYSDILKAFDKAHRNCPKTWEEPKVDQSLSETVKALWWKDGMNASRGMSSEAMWITLFNNSHHHNQKSHPCDPDDFSRCYLLLQTVPEWKEKLHLMKPVSPVWERLVDNWDKLTAMYEQNVAEGWKNYKEIGMYEFMKSIGC